MLTLEQIDALLDLIRDHSPVPNRESTAQWQAFWDDNPDLKAAHYKLYLMRRLWLRDPPLISEFEMPHEQPTNPLRAKT